MIEVICGPMYSGKSNELIVRVMKARIAELNPILIKHSLDDRFSIDKIVTRVGVDMKCLLAPNEDILDSILSQNNTKFVAIDEVQFFNKNILKVLKKHSDKDFLLCGLDLTWQGQPFGCMPELLSFADNVIKLKAVCTNNINGKVCGKPASKSKKLINDDSIIDIGDKEKYEARCTSCWYLK
jgi:thymidine kinase